MRWRAAFALAVLSSWATLLLANRSPQQRYNEPQNLRETVLRNAQALENLERNVRELERWRDTFTVADTLKTVSQTSELATLRLEVDAHERLIWAIATAVIVVVVGGVFSLFGQRTIKKQMNSRMDDLLIEHGRAERARGRRESFEEQRWTGEERRHAERRKKNEENS